jgi:hypothetical protein
MSVTLFTRNLLELGTVTAPAAAGYPKERLFDRSRKSQWQADAAGTKNIDLDLGAGFPASAWGLVNHNVAGAVTLRKSTDGSIYTDVDAADVTGADPFVRTFSAVSSRWWRFVLPAGATIWQLGELFLGVPNLIARDPGNGMNTEIHHGNVVADESPAGREWRFKRGPKRLRFTYGWELLEVASDWAALVQAFDESDDGAKAFLLVTPEGAVRWVFFEVPKGGSIDLEGAPAGGNYWRGPIKVPFIEAL